MIDYKNPAVLKHLFDGSFGLEKESLRITPEGTLAHTPHPFEDPHIVCDFCANQTEINTGVHPDLEGAMHELCQHTYTIQKKLAEQKELLWPFSSPPIIKNEEDIPVAYSDKKDEAWKYRMYLSSRYGRYRMTFSGIHYNFSFGDDLLKAAFEQSGYKDYRAFVDDVYLDLAAKSSIYGWIINVLTSASPVIDGSFYEKSLAGHSYFSGMSSLRNSEMGYWNFFTPVLDFSSLSNYINSIQSLVDEQFLKGARELYYPVRLKPAGKYSLEHLKESGINHVELRMLDLNPLEKSGLNLEDARFIHLLLVWLICRPPMVFSPHDQLMTEQNFKNAAHYDLKTTKIVDFSDRSQTVFEAAIELLDQIRDFYQEAAPEYVPLIEGQKKKLTDPHHYRYSWKIRRDFEEGFVKKGVRLAKVLQQDYLENGPCSGIPKNTEAALQE